MQELTERLTMVLGQVRYARQDSAGGRIIDVGSDHGYLAIRCLEEGLADEAVCTEIHRAPAQRSEDALTVLISLISSPELLRITVIMCSKM